MYLIIHFGSFRQDKLARSYVFGYGVTANIAVSHSDLKRFAAARGSIPRIRTETNYSNFSFLTWPGADNLMSSKFVLRRLLDFNDQLLKHAYYAEFFPLVLR